jgi:HB1, ASXL, restriction endonuclease HTH domain
LHYLHFVTSATDATPNGEASWGAELSALKERLEEILRRPKVTARDAEEAGEAAKALADLLRGEERALRLLRAEDPAPPNSSDHVGLPAEASRRYWLTGLPLHEAAERVLEDSGWPMHVGELGLLIKVRGWQHPRSKDAPPDRIRYQLAARLPRHPDVFKKFAPNTFGLATWGDSPPRTQRPKPRLGIAASDGPFEQLDGEELMEDYFSDEANSPWS